MQALPDPGRRSGGGRPAAPPPRRTLHNTLTANEQALLLEVRRFAPAAFDLTAADQLLRGCAVRRRELQTAQAEAAQARMRADLLAQQGPGRPGGGWGASRGAPRPRPGGRGGGSWPRVRGGPDRRPLPGGPGGRAAPGRRGPRRCWPPPPPCCGRRFRTWRREYQAPAAGPGGPGSGHTPPCRPRFSPALGPPGRGDLRGADGGPLHRGGAGPGRSASPPSRRETLSTGTRRCSPPGTADQLYLAVRAGHLRAGASPAERGPHHPGRRPGQF